MRFLIHVLALALAVPAAAVAQQQDFSQVEIKAEKVTDGLYMLTGRGGNLGLSVGASGSFLIDDQFAPLGTKADLKSYRDTLQTLRDRIAKLKALGQTRDAVIAAKPTADYDAQWGTGFMKPDVWTGLVFDSVP